MTNRKLFFWLLTAAFLYISAPLLFPVAMGGVLSVLFMPLLFSLERRKVPRFLAAGFLTLCITLVLILPISIMTFSAAKAGLALLQGIKKPESGASLLGVGHLRDSLVQSAAGHQLIETLTSLFPIEAVDLSDALQALIDGVGARMTELLGGWLGQLPGLFLGLVVTMVSIYFFMVDGRALAILMRRNPFLTARETDRLLTTLWASCRSVILASVVSGASQAALQVIACLLTGVAHAIQIGFCVFLGSFVPIIGSLPILLFVVGHEFLQGRSTEGWVLAGFALLTVTVDNLIRPLFLRGTVHLHPLVAFIAAFGGIQTLGFLGVFLGPIVAAVFVAAIDLYFEKALTEGAPLGLNPAHGKKNQRRGSNHDQ
jgi:predicted PurR-regulated permease PerM